MTNTTPTYRGDPGLKADLVADMRAHAAADRLMPGAYWEPDDSAPRGCAVGCTVASRLAAEQGVSIAQVVTNDISWHSEWARVTGLPQWIAHVDDLLFESLAQQERLAWPVRLLEAVPVGVDLDAAREAWLRDLVFDPERGAMASAASALEAAAQPAEAARLRGVPRTAAWAAAADAVARAAAADAVARAAAEAAAEAVADAAWAVAGAAAGAVAVAAWAVAEAVADAARAAAEAVARAADAVAEDAEAAARAAAEAAADAAAWAVAEAARAAWAVADAAWAVADAARAARAAADAARAARAAARADSLTWIADRLIAHLGAAATPAEVNA